jgi:hypothetical protein
LNCAFLLAGNSVFFLIALYSFFFQTFEDKGLFTLLGLVCMFFANAVALFFEWSAL